MTCHNITPDLIKELSYASKCRLADALRVVDPTKVKIVGSVTLDGAGEIVSVDAFVES